ncbi:MAG: AsmA-like C-terminal region-containing protein [Gemmataceae bacterium]|nr:AsmA-like C-terminal region-containing protein [Gemmataceae bacterium]
MASARRVGRYALVGAVVVVGVVVLLRVGAGVYFNSSAGRAAVAGRLGAAIGLPVEVSEVDLGTRSQSIGFRVLDPALGSGPGAGVLGVDSASADVSLGDLLTGNTLPDEVRLKGVRVTLRLDAAGNVVTTLPKFEQGGGRTKLPAIVVEDGRLTVRQEGRPEFTLGGLSLRAEPSGDVVKLSGTVTDPGWGNWTVSADIRQTAGTGRLDLSTDGAQLDTARFRSIPYIPPSVWENVQPNGPARASIGLAYGADKVFRYDVRVEPTGAAVGVPAAHVTLADVRGIVRVHDGLVEVGGVEQGTRATGKLAGGTVTVAARWDYAKEPAVADPVAVTVDRLAVDQLPPQWGLAKVLPGKLTLENGVLSGSANLRLLAHADGRLETFGGGDGRITGSVAGGTVEIDVTLGGDGQKLEFGRGKPPAKKAALEETPPPNPLPATERGDRSRLARSSLVPPPPQGEGEGKGVGKEQGRGTRHLTVTTPEELAALVTLLAVQPKADQPRTDQTDLDATITLRDIDIAQFVQQLELKVPYKVAGKVTVQAKLAVPLGEAATRSSYRLSGTLTSSELRLEGLTVRDLTTEVNLKDGKLTLSKLTAAFPQPGDPAAAPGSLSGTATAAIDPAGDVTAALTLDRIPLGAVLGAVPGLGIEVRGVVSGKAQFKAPFERVADPATWDTSATLRSPELVVAGRTAKDVAFTAVAAKGVVTLTEGAVTVEGVPVTAAGTLALTGKYAFDATVKTTGTSVTDLRKLVPEAELPVPVEGVLETDTKLTGTLSPLTFTASGRVRASKLTLGKTAANAVDLRWEVTPERVKLADLNAAVFGGTVAGSAEYPLVPDKGGAFDVAFKGVDAAAAAALAPGFPVRIGGAVSGKVTGTIPPANANEGRVGNLELDLTAPRLTVQNIPAERLVGKASVKDGAVDYSLEGRTLGGSFEVKGRYPGARKKEADKDNRGSLRVEGVDLSQLAGALRSEALRPLAGRVDLNFEFLNDLSAGSGRLSVRGVRWGRDEFAPEVRGVLLLRDGQFEVRDLSGTVAGGILRGRARVSTDDPTRNFFSVTIDRADGRRLTAPVPGTANLLTGDVSVTVRGRVGREVRGSGVVTVGRGTVSGVVVNDLRVPFDYATTPGGYGRLAVRGASTRAGTGRATADLTVEWGAGVRVDGQARFVDVPLAAIAPSIGENSFFGPGRLTGRFDLAGTNVRSAADLTGTLVAALSNATVREVPLLQEALPYLNTLGLARPFRTGDVRGTLRGGVFRVQRLALANPGAQVFAEGTITTAGRLDLNVIAHTGQVGPEARGLRLLALRLPAFGPVPLGLIKDVSDFLSNRTIRLTITGTTASPVVRVNARALLADEAVRFFLTRYVVPGELAGVLGIGSAAGAIGAGSSGGMAMPRR